MRRHGVYLNTRLNAESETSFLKIKERPEGEPSDLPALDLLVYKLYNFSSLKITLSSNK
jgi:hypothetical protein